MKRFLLWLVGVALGVVLLLAAVMGVSYAFITEGSCPDSAAQFGAEELEVNSRSKSAKLRVFEKK